MPLCLYLILPLPERGPREQTPTNPLTDRHPMQPGASALQPHSTRFQGHRQQGEMERTSL